MASPLTPFLGQFRKIKNKKNVVQFYTNLRRGRLFFFFSIVCYRLSFSLSWFPKTGIERQHWYLSYELFEISITLFIRILWIDSHSWLNAPRTRYECIKKISFFLNFFSPCFLVVPDPFSHFTIRIRIHSTA